MCTQLKQNYLAWLQCTKVNLYRFKYQQDPSAFQLLSTNIHEDFRVKVIFFLISCKESLSLCILVDIAKYFNGVYYTHCVLGTDHYSHKSRSTLIVIVLTFISCKKNDLFTNISCGSACISIIVCTNVYIVLVFLSDRNYISVVITLAETYHLSYIISMWAWYLYTCWQWQTIYIGGDMCVHSALISVEP